MKKVVIVGGVAGGMSAATRLRRLQETAEIIVVEKGPYVSFANCGLPYYVSGEIADREALLLQTPEKLQARFALDVRTDTEAIEIDAEEKIITLKKGTTVYQESYDYLILSPGARPIVPAIAGLEEATNLFTLRNVPDVDQIMSFVAAEKPQTATVIGAGFIGLEMAENLAKKGLHVTIVEQAPQILPPLDEEMAVFVSSSLERHQLKVITGQSAVALKQSGRQLFLTDGTMLLNDLIILAVGVQPETSLAKTAGIELGLRGGIIVDEQYRTNIPTIFAVGDAIITKQQITGEDALISLASPANRQGRQVADILSGIDRKHQGSIGTAIVRVFDLTAAATGLSERQVKQAGLPYQVVHLLGKDHAGYFPGATELQLKLVFHPENGKIYGAQAVGAKGVDKRIDSVATAIKGGLTVFDLSELEFTYAPPFGSAKDPVNMLGYMAQNIIEGYSEIVQWHEVPALIEAGAVILDVRNRAELSMGHLPASINIPLDELRGRLSELSQDTTYIVSCHSGQRSYLAERLLKQAGFTAKNLDGAFALYRNIRPEEIIYGND